MTLAAWMVAAPWAWADDVDIDVRGIDNPLLDNVRKSLSVAADHDDPWSGAQIRRLFRLAPGEIRSALQPYGYYNPRIDTQLKPPAKGDTTWQARFKVKQGPPTKITRLKLALTGPGDQFDTMRRALEQTQLKKGERLDQSQYTATKSALQSAATQSGYLDATFTQSQIRVNPGDNRAQIDLVMDTGPRYYFGPVTFKQDVLYDDFVKRFVPFSPGEPFNADALVNMQLGLSDTDYFSQMEINAERNNAERHQILDQWFYDLIYPPADPLEALGQLRIPITVTAQPSKSQSYTVSGGYGTDTGPRLGLGVKFRHLNKSGHKFRLDLGISQIKQALQAAYDIPIENVASDKLSFTGQIANEQYGDISSINYGVGAIRDTGWKYGRQRMYIKLEDEIYDLKDGAGSRNSILLYPGYTITARRANGLLNPTKGVSASFDVHGGSSSVLSATNFVSADLTGKTIFPVLPRTTLVLRGELGAIHADKFQELPPSQRFFAGGDNSVRGYAYQSISPTNANNNDDIGGQYKAVGSIETDFRVYGNYGVAAFFDAGDVTNSVSNLSFKRGVGVGFRWASPVGMIRLDLAHPLDDSSTPVRVHFSLGPQL